ncbi:MAG TPA: RsbRD N-terminal domain-containing protein, partial [Gemmatimonadales bacterium]|nr:RsbRD N-terminal domain-containing protein [Gemmatimonadales bacterium]
MSPQTRIPEILKTHEQELLSEWLREQIPLLATQQGRISDADLRAQSREFLSLFQRAAQTGDFNNLNGPAWRDVTEMLTGVSAARAKQGFTPVQTASFVMSLKRPLFARLNKEYATDAAGLADDTWQATAVLDQLGLHTTNAFFKTREEIITRQQEEMLELSTPVVKLWEGILALPMIGTLDSTRTQVVMESLLQRIVETGADVAIIDIDLNSGARYEHEPDGTTGDEIEGLGRRTFGVQADLTNETEAREAI